MAGFRSTTLILLALSLTACASDPHRDTALSHEGKEALLAGDMKTAEARLKEALEVNPNNPYALTDLSTLYIKQSRYELARPLCERVIANEDEYEKAAETSEQSKEAARVVQMARDNLTTIDKGQAEEQALLDLKPDNGAPAVTPLVREPAPVPSPASAEAAPAAADPAAVTTAAPDTATTPVAATAPVAANAATTSPAAASETAPPPAPVHASRAGVHYRIQVGAFKSRGNAERLGERLKERYHDAMVEKEIRLAEAGGLVKVQIGPYQNLKEASEACRTFSQAGLRCFPRQHD